MIKVKVGELRNKLSSYLKRVRHGAEIVITDRETPIGRLVPYREEKKEALDIIPPKKGYIGFADLDFPDMDIDFDPVDIL
ncbi:MAG: type II toxin-antitoxin system prevent-host-death family antitoxin, partial [Deltaproteobacteria bacterium]|nr:type II toxin-antitoxin system prevent-host-death family antitoxin [Deltaproteobacteria bacterium]